MLGTDIVILFELEIGQIVVDVNRVQKWTFNI